MQSSRIKFLLFLSIFAFTGCGGSSDPEQKVVTKSGATSFKIGTTLYRGPDCLMVRIATYDGNDLGTLKEGCMDGNNNFVTQSENKIIQLTADQKTKLKSNLSAIDLGNLSPSYYALVSGVDETNFLLQLNKERETHSKFIALRNAKDLPEDLKRFLETASNLSFLPGIILDNSISK